MTIVPSFLIYVLWKTAFQVVYIGLPALVCSSLNVVDTVRTVKVLYSTSASVLWDVYIRISTDFPLYIRGGADKSLARPNFRCRRTESIVSLERGVCSCAELQVYSCYRGWKEACQATRSISTTSKRDLSSSFFPARQGAEGNSRHSERNIRGPCTILCHRQKLGGPV